MWAKGEMSFRVLAGVLLLMSFLLRDLENQFVQLCKRRDEFMQNLIDEVRGSVNEGEAKTLIQVLLDLNEAKPDYYKDDVIMSLMQAIQNDPKIWGDPENFRPERFQEGGNVGLGFMPFGSGRRKCPGEGLATRVVVLALGALIQCFNWDRISEEMVDMTEGHGLFAPKVVTLKAKCAARPSMTGVHHAMNPDPYKGVFGSDGEKYVKDVDDLIQFGTSGNVVGFISEAIQGVGGIVELAPGYQSAIHSTIKKV
ncbi:hypothetical protein AgCh_004054 [Apium graveolens]